MNPRRKQPNSAVKMIRVGVVADDAATREILAPWFRRTSHIQMLWGHADVEAALLALAQAPCDVVLTDINLPGENGIQFLRRAKLAVANAHFVMVTVYVAQPGV